MRVGYFKELLLDVSDVGCLFRIKRELADSNNKLVNSAGYTTQEKECQSSGSESFGLKTGVVDYKATKRSKPKDQEKTSYFHCG